jgi:hypothetical protein
MAPGTACFEANVLLEQTTGTDQTATITAQCQATFKVMADTMRDFKCGFFPSTSLVENDGKKDGWGPHSNGA